MSYLLIWEWNKKDPHLYTLIYIHTLILVLLNGGVFFGSMILCSDNGAEQISFVGACRHPLRRTTWIEVIS